MRPHPSGDNANNDPEVPITCTDMTIGEFSLLTGLTPKALRLYDERGILKPAAVDPLTGYRWYTCEQVRHGATLWALRQGGVPLAELDQVETFDVEGFRERQQVKRTMEDTALRMALAYQSIEVADWPVSAAAAAAQPWIATCISITLHEDSNPQDVFLPLPDALERHRSALGVLLRTYGNDTDAPWWTTAGRSAVGDVSTVEMRVCVPAERDQRSLDWDGFVADLRAALDDASLPVVAGVLPPRLEVFCTADVDHDDERASMASDLAMRLAIDAYIRDRNLRPLTPHTRAVCTGPSSMSPTVTVRDVALLRTPTLCQ